MPGVFGDYSFYGNVCLDLRLEIDDLESLRRVLRVGLLAARNLLNRNTAIWRADRGYRCVLAPNQHGARRGVSAAGAVIDLVFAGYRTQDELLEALKEHHGREVVFAS